MFDRDKQSGTVYRNKHFWAELRFDTAFTIGYLGMDVTLPLVPECGFSLLAFHYVPSDIILN